MQTRQQKYMQQALQDVIAIRNQHAKEDGTTVREPDEIAQKYGTACHKLPVMLRTNGLCQTIAFIEAKAADHDATGKAYKILKSQIATALGSNSDQLLKRAYTTPAGEYIRDTRILLDAWTYYIRFVVSVLGVKAGLEDTGGDGNEPTGT